MGSGPPGAAQTSPWVGEPLSCRPAPSLDTKAQTYRRGRAEKGSRASWAEDTGRDVIVIGARKEATQLEARRHCITWGWGATAPLRPAQPPPCCSAPQGSGDVGRRGPPPLGPTLPLTSPAQPQFPHL